MESVLKYFKKNVKIAGSDFLDHAKTSIYYWGNIIDPLIILFVVSTILFLCILKFLFYLMKHPIGRNSIGTQFLQIGFIIWMFSNDFSVGKNIYDHLVKIFSEYFIKHVKIGGSDFLDFAKISIYHLRNIIDPLIIVVVVTTILSLCISNFSFSNPIGTELYIFKIAFFIIMFSLLNVILKESVSGKNHNNPMITILYSYFILSSVVQVFHDLKESLSKHVKIEGSDFLDHAEISIYYWGNIIAPLIIVIMLVVSTLVFVSFYFEFEFEFVYFIYYLIFVLFCLFILLLI
jgi:hypothetical protein